MQSIREFVLRSALGALVAVIATAGCEQGAPGTGMPGASTPKESFDSVLATFRRGIETGSGGVVAGSGGISHGDGGYTSFSIDNRVSYEYFPPANEGDEPRATITVASKSRVSVQPAQPGEGRDKRDERGGRGDETDLDVDVLDPATISVSKGASRPADLGLGPQVPEARETTDARRYDLVYRSRRWQLVTQIDSETDKAALDAFEYALKTQL